MVQMASASPIRLSRAAKLRRNSLPELRIGTSGWHYADWWGPFYPETLKKKDALSHYVTRFNTAELNAPFYRTPTEQAVRNWAESTPEDFRFAWKASRFITHWRRLIVDQNSMQLLESRLDLLGDKLGPVLFQLPPQMKVDRERLAGFIEALPPARRYSFEFRHESWYEAAILALLAEHDMSLCLSDHAAAPAPWEATASWVYIRNHGPTGRYHGNYGKDALAGWADQIAGWQEEGRDVWCFFDNDVKSAAPADAAKLAELVDRD
jgi:uncharacterized protein YecE (DUF72 family)